ncbi:MAG: AAA family ATPase [Sphaerochaetaceae bacterium]|jgi:AAA15 family ATPase/GTPase|uniref:AAA family ATPase n=1 Tax=Treponema ruminis TaxID=744515 RepID=UPI00197E65EE|nr:AAA family ATPase [Treponema ruminis]MCI6674891.1 ATP-binding protein [Spirochaetaceae bacterium]MDY6343952.1 AAA family ATPase [Sphaerochaetaceae bacterium]QSI03308.1 ATP-binding protein [Treponema ruminis]
MLTSVKVRNVGSVGFASVTLEKAGYRYLEQYVLADKVSNPIAIYGCNGSGKSSFLGAFTSLVGLLDDEPDKISGFVPNILAQTKDITTEYGAELEFILADKHYRYYLFEDNDGIAREGLVVDHVEVLVRNRDKYTYRDGTHRIESRLYPALRDVVAKGIADSVASEAFGYLSNIAYVRFNTNEYKVKAFRDKALLDVMAEKSQEVRRLLNQYRAFPSYDIVSFPDITEKKRYAARLDIGDGQLTLPVSMISDGMINQSMLLSILSSLPKNGVLVVDEIDRALHPLTLMDFINVAVEKGVQLIFSGHNTNVLSRLRPDNIVFADWHAGFSTYKRLSDIYPNIREVNNIEKMYLSSTFDALIKGRTE